MSRAFSLLLACSFTEAETLFLFCSFLSYVTSYVNCQATNTRTHTHTHRQQQRSRRQASPIQTHKAFRAVSLACSLSLALSRCVFSLSSLKVKEEGCRCRCRRSRRWQRAASSDKRSRLQLSQRTKLSDHCNVGRWILRLQRWAVLQELISIKNCEYFIYIVKILNNF